jgi:hypothetical protein
MMAVATPETEFQTYIVVDPYFKNMPAMSLAIPQGWSATSAVKWVIGDIVDPSDYDYPVNAWARAEDRASGSAIEQFPTLNFGFVPGMMPLSLPSLPSLSGLMSSLFGAKPAAPPPPPPPPSGPPRMVGATMLAPLAGADAVVKCLLPRYRANLPDLRVLGSFTPPDRVEQAKAMAQPGMATEPVGVRIEYTVAGRLFEEEITALKRQWDVSATGPMGTMVQTNWDLFAPVGLRAPKGTLDSMKPLMTRALSLSRINPEWIKLRDQVHQQLQQQAQALLQQGYSAIAAAGAVSRQISANSDAMLRSMDAGRQKENAEWRQSRAAQAAADARSPTAGFDDYIRGVNTYEDPYWGQSQHSLEHQYAWTDGSGNYKYSDDASFDPNIGANQAWQLMKRV